MRIFGLQARARALMTKFFSDTAGLRFQILRAPGFDDTIFFSAREDSDFESSGSGFHDTIFFGLGFRNAFRLQKKHPELISKWGIHNDMNNFSIYCKIFQKLLLFFKRHFIMSSYKEHYQRKNHSYIVLTCSFAAEWCGRGEQNRYVFHLYKWMLILIKKFAGF